MPLDDSVQYIATQDFVRTLLSDMDDVPTDILNLLTQHYDFRLDPGLDNLDGRPRSFGEFHPSERELLWERDNDHNTVKRLTEDLKSGQPGARTPFSGPVPFQLIAMALKRSPQGKARVILTDDPGLIEMLQFYDIDTLESDDFIQKLQQDQVIGPEYADTLRENVMKHKEQHQKGFSQDVFEKHRTNAQDMEARRATRRVNLETELPLQEPPNPVPRDKGAGPELEL